MIFAKEVDLTIAPETGNVVSQQGKCSVVGIASLSVVGAHNPHHLVADFSMFEHGGSPSGLSAPTADLANPPCSGTRMQAGSRVHPNCRSFAMYATSTTISKSIAKCSISELYHVRKSLMDFCDRRDTPQAALELALEACEAAEAEMRSRTPQTAGEVISKLLGLLGDDDLPHGVDCAVTDAKRWLEVAA